METSEKKYLTCAETAKLVRKALKNHWPKTKFSIRSHTYAGGASIDIGYIDGPTFADVEKIAHPYEGADFDGMQDLKTHHDTNFTDEQGNIESMSLGADFVCVHRSYSAQYDWLLCDMIDLQNGAPDLKTQVKNLWHHQSAYPYLEANSMAGSIDGKSFKIFSKGIIDGAERVTKCFRLQGYEVKQYQEDGKEVFEVSAK